MIGYKHQHETKNDERDDLLPSDTEIENKQKMAERKIK